MQQGDIYITDFEPSVGREYKKERPAVIVSGTTAISNSPLITVMPITSNIKNKRLDDIAIDKNSMNKLHKNSIIRVADIYSFDRKRLKARIGVIENNIMAKIKSYIPKHFDL